jgi:hypothetical protein
VHGGECIGETDGFCLVAPFVVFARIVDAVDRLVRRAIKLLSS